MSATLTTLKERYSVLLTLAQLAEVLNRSPDGLRISLSSSQSDWADQINSTKVKIGRRVYFRTEGIARLIDEAFSAHDS
ncbi:hypothetical protein [Kerstersia gyiorum]|uniref:Plasmid-related protein n=1 Tax=Kerstersia gyiorum TaxID=206506 RepID=A0A171KRM5_9BURK|nr:hypothetical protein [Kerstersia gyiorum]KKO71542.1 hypothetical protein AAV32_10085 [Kerstersia gyiorum]